MIIKSLNNVSVFTNIPFNIEENRILRELRIPLKRKLDDLDEKRLGKELKNIINLAYGLIHGKACYSTFKIIDISESKVILDKSETLIKGRKLVNTLKDCEYCSLFVSTIGIELEQHVAEMKKNDPSGAFYLEHIGSWMAEFMAKAVNERISQEIIKAGFSPKKRFSAGYGGWSIESQNEILKLTKANRIGLSISESFLMTPRKSVSALVGWGKI